jgi:hypothetical protein
MHMVFMPSGTFDNYINQVKGNNILAILEELKDTTSELLKSIDEKKSMYAYAEGKWTIKEIIGHLADSERVFAYRALRFGRNDKTVLSPFEQDDYIAAGNFNNRSIDSLAKEFRLIRESNIELFKSFGKKELERHGFSGKTEFTVESLLYIIAGHEIHHIKIIKEKYL